jgi:hypothetical protein
VQTNGVLVVVDIRHISEVKNDIGFTDLRLDESATCSGPRRR